MKALLAALFLLSLPLYAADEKPWPQKGDTVYVAANVTAIKPVLSRLGGVPVDSPIPACWPMIAAKPHDCSWILIPGKDLVACMRGDEWASRFHRSAEECAAVFAKHGQPIVLSASGANQLRPH